MQLGVGNIKDMRVYMTLWSIGGIYENDVRRSCWYVCHSGGFIEMRFGLWASASCARILIVVALMLIRAE